MRIINETPWRAFEGNRRKTIIDYKKVIVVDEEIIVTNDDHRMFLKIIYEDLKKNKPGWTDLVMVVDHFQIKFSCTEDSSD